MPIAIESLVNLKNEAMRFVLPSGGIRIVDGAFTLVIGQNGSGKTTLIEATIGVRIDYKVERVILGDARAELANATKQKLGVSTQVQSFADGVLCAGCRKAPCAIISDRGQRHAFGYA